MTGSRRVVVFGSLNADITFEVPRIPVSGETVVAGAVRRAPGGKGANQAHAAARTAHDVTVMMAGAVGDDEAGSGLREDLARVGVDVSNVRRSPGESGMAMIAVDRGGDNIIVVTPGANHRWPELPEVPVAPGDVLVLQLELPLHVVEHVARIGRAAGARVVLNAAPATGEARRLLGSVDVLVVNEGEAAELLGLTSVTEPAAGAIARSHGLDLVVTLGADGAILADRTGEARTIPAFPAQSIDSVGAGDAFVGALASALAAGDDLAGAARRGAAAGALTVAVPGARHPSLSAHLVDEVLRSSAVPARPASVPTLPPNTHSSRKNPS